MQVRYDVSGCIQVFDARTLMFVNGLDDRFCDAAIRRVGRVYGGRLTLVVSGGSGLLAFCVFAWGAI